MMKNANQSNSKSSKNSVEQDKPVTPLHEFKTDLESQKDVEEKLRKSLEFMRKALSQKGSPRFKDFWEAKKICLPFFKEKINPAAKAKYWAEYTELSTEAKHLKEILDEQSSFAVEQIELALTAIQDDLENHEKHIDKLKPIVFPKDLFFVKDKLKTYEQLQKQISFYITLSARTKDLRKEILQTEMRIRSKNKLLEKLSKLADSFLPRKKELIKEISEEFSSDVAQFASTYFDLEKKSLSKKELPVFKLRDEIKAFQSFAKFLSLNSHAFSESRLTLSICWSILKEAEKHIKSQIAEKKKEAEEKIAVYKEKLSQIVEQFSANKPKSKEDVTKEIAKLFEEIKEARLHKADFGLLKKEIRATEEKLLEPFYEEEKKVQENFLKQQKEAEEKIQTLKEKYLNILAKSSSHSLKDIKEALNEVETHQKQSKLSFVDEIKFAEIHKELYEVSLLKTEEEIESEDQKALEQLLAEWEDFRESTRSNLENYRKEMGRSGFDFEKAMLYREHIDIEKDRLDRIVEKIEGIENLID